MVTPFGPASLTRPGLHRRAKYGFTNVTDGENGTRRNEEEERAPALAASTDHTLINASYGSRATPMRCHASSPAIDVPSRARPEPQPAPRESGSQKVQRECEKL
eukprot:6952807-Prymnesium_polylepis.1